MSQSMPKCCHSVFSLPHTFRTGAILSLPSSPPGTHTHPKAFLLQVKSICPQEHQAAYKQNSSKEPIGKAVCSLTLPVM